ncbi:hypothetical protein BpHYR1_029400, partial [Brachionus plicatilis]
TPPSPQPYPQLVIPANSHFPLFSTTNGPPESPWQVSLPSPVSPAQTATLVLTEEYFCLHLESVKNGISTCIKYLETEPPELKVPQPVAHELLPEKSALPSGIQTGTISSSDIVLQCSVGVTWMSNDFGYFSANSP